MSSNSPMSFLDEEKFNAERLLALKYIKERIDRASTIQNILAPIGPQDEFIFDVARVDDNASEVSELSDPFDLGANIIASAENKQKRRLSKVEADVLVMNSFPPAHMEIQNKLLAGLPVSEPFQLDIDKIMEEASWKNDDEKEVVGEPDVFQEISASFDAVGLAVYKEEKRKVDEKDKLLRPKARPKKTKTQEELDLEAKSMLSGVWRMLGKIKFEITAFKFKKYIFKLILSIFNHLKICYARNYWKK